MGDGRPTDSFKALKGQMKLDLNAPPAQPKVDKMLSQILKSPQFEMISRELAQSIQMATPTPTTLWNPPALEVSNAQKQYAQGFLDALRHVQQMENFRYDNNILSPSVINLVTPILETEMMKSLSSPLVSPLNPKDVVTVLQAIQAQTPISAPQKLLPEDTSSTTVSSSSSLTRPTLASLAQQLQFESSFKQLINTSTPSTSTGAGASGSSSTYSQPPPPPVHLNIPKPDEKSISSISPQSSTISTNNIQHQPTNTAIMDSMGETDISNRFSRGISELSDDMSSRSSSTGPSGRLLPSRGERLEDMSMDDQERRKLERKRLRNRMAASKCRQKKLERIADLEQQVSEEKQRGIAIDNELEKMRVLFRDVQQKVLQHQQRGCQGTPAFAFKC